MLSKDEVAHIAKLAKLELSDEELERFTPQLGSILDFFGTLQKVNTDDIEETSQVTGLENIARPDSIEVQGLEDDLLACTPNKVEAHSVKIPKIM